MVFNKFIKRLQNYNKNKNISACKFGIAVKTGHEPKSKYPVQALLTLFFVIIFVPLTVLTSCKFEKLGLSTDSIGSSNNTEINISGTDTEPDILNEQGFYSLKNLQKDKNPLNNINVRKAIFYAIDRERIVAELLGEYGSVLNSLFPPGADYYADFWSQYNYNPVAAKEFLNKSGHNDSNPLFITIGANSDSPSRQIIENIVKENLAAIGITCWITNKESKEWYLDFIKNGDYDMGVWSIYVPDIAGIEGYFSSGKIPSMETDTNINCNNFYWYSNPDFDLLMNAILQEDNPDKKIETNSQMQKILSDDAIVLPLYSRVYATAYSRKLSNVEIDTLNGSFFKNISGMDINSESTTKTKSESESTKNAGNIKSLVAGYEQEPYVLNPLIPDSIHRDYIDSLIMQGLWEKTGPDKYEPLLVESIFIEEGRSGKNTSLRNSLKASIKLRNDIFWEDGEPIVADDVVATINAIKSDVSLTFSDKNYGIIESIEKTGNKEFVVTFNEFASNWEQLFNYIFPVKLLQEDAISSIFSEDIIGSGPYKLKEWKKGEYVLLEKNSYYNGEPPIINEIKFLFNSDINYLVGMLQEGNIDILSIPADLELMKSIEESENLSLKVASGYLFEHLAICLKPEE